MVHTSHAVIGAQVSNQKSRSYATASVTKLLILSVVAVMVLSVCSVRRCKHVTIKIQYY